ncbi:MAG TPA: hypothetical protein VFF53_04195, partial [Geobacteraceae bacterium]|nr:hypothetical protein [Geobacteraceae bacterium]
MPSGFDFKKLRRLIKIYAVVQVALVALLLYVALLFQTNLGPLFWKSILITLVIQLVNFYPVNLFATREARREIAATAIGLTPEELKVQRQQRLVGDVLKMAVFGFFIIFVYKSPVTPNVQANRFYQSLIFFN